MLMLLFWTTATIGNSLKFSDILALFNRFSSSKSSSTTTSTTSTTSPTPILAKTDEFLSMMPTSFEVQRYRLGLRFTRSLDITLPEPVECKDGTANNTRCLDDPDCADANNNTMRIACEAKITMMCNNITEPSRFRMCCRKSGGLCAVRPVMQCKDGAETMNNTQCLDDPDCTDPNNHTKVSSCQGKIENMCRTMTNRDPQYCTANAVYMRRCCKESCGLCETSVGPLPCHGLNKKACIANAGCLYNTLEDSCIDKAFCSDGVKNGDETGIDCGGTCKRPCQCMWMSDDSPSLASGDSCSMGITRMPGYCQCWTKGPRNEGGSRDRSFTCGSICVCKDIPHCAHYKEIRRIRINQFVNVETLPERNCKCVNCYGNYAAKNGKCVECPPIEYCMEYSFKDGVCHCDSCERHMIFNESTSTCRPLCYSPRAVNATDCVNVPCPSPSRGSKRVRCQRCIDFPDQPCGDRRKVTGFCVRQLTRNELIGICESRATPAR